MIPNIGHQKTKKLGTPVRDFLDWITGGGKTHRKSGSHLLLAAHIHINTHERRLFACLALLVLASSPILFLRGSFATITIDFLKIQILTEDQRLFVNPPGL